jgi:hypothetical protein
MRANRKELRPHESKKQKCCSKPLCQGPEFKERAAQRKNGKDMKGGKERIYTGWSYLIEEQCDKLETRHIPCDGNL